MKLALHMENYFPRNENVPLSTSLQSPLTLDFCDHLLLTSDGFQNSPLIGISRFFIYLLDFGEGIVPINM